ncbi:MAG: BolA family transcriptional regulator [Alphaproteobacteria bacterium]|nr:BolA family transcriptional regulator [Alphaproteobacteria bacterium]
MREICIVYPREAITARKRLCVFGKGQILEVSVNRAERIRAAVEAAFEVQRIEVRDDSHLHAGHAGARPEGETHFDLLVVSSEFTGQSRVTRQRAVYGLLSAELEGGLHALSIRALTPDEAIKETK